MRAFVCDLTGWKCAGTLATAGVLVVGLVAFKQGNSALSQQVMQTSRAGCNRGDTRGYYVCCCTCRSRRHIVFAASSRKDLQLTPPPSLAWHLQMMRARIVAQGATVAIMIASGVGVMAGLDKE